MHCTVWLFYVYLSNPKKITHIDYLYYQIHVETLTCLLISHISLGKFWHLNITYLPLEIVMYDGCVLSLRISRGEKTFATVKYSFFKWLFNDPMHISISDVFGNDTLHKEKVYLRPEWVQLSNVVQNEMNNLYFLISHSSVNNSTAFR